MTVRSWVCIGVCLALSACGGGGGSDSDSTNPPAVKSSIQGKAIDGYIKGATVYLDLNFNKRLDAGEPSSVTTELGDYRMELTGAQEQCAEYVPLVVDVPVGAVDLDTGVVEQAYQMVLPPKFTPISNDDLLHVTPLTTVLWSDVEKQLASDGALTCQSVMADQLKREKIAFELRESTNRVIKHYNISEKKLYADYIASGDSETATLAMEIVRGLQASFGETEVLKKQHPDAFYAYVDYHIGDNRDLDNAYPNAWYREQGVYWDDRAVTQLAKVSSDFTQVIRQLAYSERHFRKTASYKYVNEYSFESKGGDDSPYACGVQEAIEHVAGNKLYELSNLVNFQANSFEECVIDNLVDVVTQRHVAVEVTNGDVKSTGEFIYDRQAGSFPFLNDWIDVADTIDALNMADLGSALEQLPYGFEDQTIEPDARFWAKTQVTTDTTGVKTEVRYNELGNYVKTVTQVDGTYTTECGTDGVIWGTCS